MTEAGGTSAQERGPFVAVKPAIKKRGKSEDFPP